MKRNFPPWIVPLSLAGALVFLIAILCSQPQDDFPGILLVTAASLPVMYGLLRLHRSIPAGLIVGVALIARIITLFHEPLLSDDYHRFWWDGHLTLSGINPYLHLPEDVDMGTLQQPESAANALSRMNSPSYYSVYPPMLQYIWVSASWLSPTAWLHTMRLIWLLLDMGTILLLLKCCTLCRIPSQAVVIYALNPLVIAEGMGNLHPEIIMVFFLALSFRLILSHRTDWASVAFGCAVATKLLPLIVLPFLFGVWPLLRTWRFFLIQGITVVLLFIPFANPQLITHIGESLSLYFHLFEFNSSIYALVSRMLIRFDIHHAPTELILSTLSATLILLLAWRNRSRQTLAHSILYAWSVYLLFSSTVHPWYIIPIVVINVFIGKWWPVVWSVLILLSYSHYAGGPASAWWITLEYALVALTAWAEYRGLPPIYRNEAISFRRRSASHPAASAKSLPREA